MPRKTIAFLIPALLLLAGRATAQSFKFVAIDVPNSTFTLASGINPQGDIVGIYGDASGYEHGFLLKDSVFTTIDVPGSLVGVSGTLQTEANGINSEGDIVGDYFAPPGAPGAPACLSAPDPACRRGFLLHKGEFSDVVVPGKKGSIPSSITPDGLIVGCDHNDDYGASMIGFVRTGFGTYMTLDAGGGELANVNQSVLASMNNGATPGGTTIVGLYTDLATNHTHGYVVHGGIFQTYDVPQSAATQIWGINPEGHFVGLYDDQKGNEHGFLQGANGDAPITIDVPSSAPFNSTLTDAFGINPAGAIVGVYVDNNNNSHGYLAVPIKDHSNE